jgi:hypothetical protein
MWEPSDTSAFPNRQKKEKFLEGGSIGYGYAERTTPKVVHTVGNGEEKSENVMVEPGPIRRQSSHMERSFRLGSDMQLKRPPSVRSIRSENEAYREVSNLPTRAEQNDENLPVDRPLNVERKRSIVVTQAMKLENENRRSFKAEAAKKISERRQSNSQGLISSEGDKNMGHSQPEFPSRDPMTPSNSLNAHESTQGATKRSSGSTLKASNANMNPPNSAQSVTPYKTADNRATSLEMPQQATRKSSIEAPPHRADAHVELDATVAPKAFQRRSSRKESTVKTRGSLKVTPDFTAPADERLSIQEKAALEMFSHRLSSGILKADLEELQGIQEDAMKKTKTVERDPMAELLELEGKSLPGKIIDEVSDGNEAGPLDEPSDTQERRRSINLKHNFTNEKGTRDSFKQESGAKLLFRRLSSQRIVPIEGSSAIREDSDDIPKISSSDIVRPSAPPPSKLLTAGMGITSVKPKERKPSSTAEAVPVRQGSGDDLLGVSFEEFTKERKDSEANQLGKADQRFHFKEEANDSSQRMDKEKQSGSHSTSNSRSHPPFGSKAQSRSVSRVQSQTDVQENVHRRSNKLTHEIIGEAEQSKILLEDSGKNPLRRRKSRSSGSSLKLLNMTVNVEDGPKTGSKAGSRAGSKANSPVGSAANSRSASRVGTETNLKSLEQNGSRQSTQGDNGRESKPDALYTYTTLAQGKPKALTAAMMQEGWQARRKSLGNTSDAASAAATVAAAAAAELEKNTDTQKPSGDAHSDADRSNHSAKEKFTYRNSVIDNYNKAMDRRESAASIASLGSGTGLGSRRNSRISNSNLYPNRSNPRLSQEAQADSEVHRTYKKNASSNKLIKNNSAKEMLAGSSRVSSGGDLNAMSSSRNTSTNDLKALSNVHDLDKILEDCGTTVERIDIDE